MEEPAAMRPAVPYSCFLSPAFCLQTCSSLFFNFAKALAR